MKKLILLLQTSITTVDCASQNVFYVELKKVFKDLALTFEHATYVLTKYHFNLKQLLMHFLGLQCMTIAKCYNMVNSDALTMKFN